MFYIKYNKENYKILGYYSNYIGVTILDNEDIKKVDTEDISQIDIRVYNEDGSVKSLGQQIKEKILVLRDNEVIKQGVVVELNPSYEDDYIKLVQRKLEKLKDTQKIEYDVEAKKYRIEEKSIEEKLKDKLITVEDYNNYIIQFRQSMYANELDAKRAELVDIILNRLSKSFSLTEEENILLQEINKIRENIKLQYKKL